MDPNTPTNDPGRTRLEWKTFLFICIFLFPILAVAIVGGYGFLVWMLQTFFLGPPGHG